MNELYMCDGKWFNNTVLRKSKNNQSFETLSGAVSYPAHEITVKSKVELHELESSEVQ